ncbi:MAG: alpha-L-fucosidase [Planctomycetes bacterium]|nr:alpha-L-fucosidase [Planctomycetota bacterium]
MTVPDRRRRNPCVVLPLLAAACAAPPAPLPAPTPATQDERMAWWREARFGLFVHWGLYALPAGKWRGEDHHGEWIRDTARIPRDEYTQLQARWNPTAFDADAWARSAAAAGMKYVVLTSKHHDGFCLFDSAHTDWDVGGTPHGRDIVAELAAACARHGLRFGTYHSIMDWHHPDYLPRRPWEAAARPTASADFDRYERHLHAQVEELVRRVRPAVMWFDGEWEPTWTHARGVRLFELCRRLAPAMLVNNRVDVHRDGMAGFSTSAEAVGDFATPEQEVPPDGLPGVDWESCMTMNAHWGWNAADTRWKSADELLRHLIDIASKGGNFLLNVGPRADGTFPPEAEDRLRHIGEWMAGHGEAIHGTTASPFDALAFGRCTVRAGEPVSRLYLHVFTPPPAGELVLPGLASRVLRAFRLGAADAALPVRRVGADVHVRLPTATGGPLPPVVAVDVDGPPVVHRTPSIAAESDVFVDALLVTVAAPGAGLDVHYTLDGSDPTAASPRAGGPIALHGSCTVKAAGFHRGSLVTGTAERRFTQVAPRPPAKVLARGHGLRLARHTVDWQRIPDDRQGLVAEHDAIAAAVALPDGIGERTALCFRGFLDVPADDLYRFALASDDGSRLWLGGELVVDNDGPHGTVERRGAIALGRGLHPLELWWWNRTGEATLSLQWARPGEPFAPVPGAALRH